MSISAIDHIAIAVKQLDEAIAFFEEKLGLNVTHREEVPKQGVKIASIDIGGVQIELIEPFDESSNLNKFLEKRGPGLHHIALKVDDLPNTLDKLKANDVRLIDDKPREGAHGKKMGFIFPNKTIGTLLELCERIDD